MSLVLSDGKRLVQTEYIGSGDARIKGALTRIERYKEHRRLQEDLERLRFRFGQVKTELDRLYRFLGLMA